MERVNDPHKPADVNTCLQASTEFYFLKYSLERRLHI